MARKKNSSQCIGNLGMGPLEILPALPLANVSRTLNFTTWRNSLAIKFSGLKAPGIFPAPGSQFQNTGLFEMIVGVLTTSHTQHTWERSICIFFYLIEQHSKFLLTYLIGALYIHPLWFYESEPPLKPSPLTSYKQFGTNSVIVLMFAESQRVHI